MQTKGVYIIYDVESWGTECDAHSDAVESWGTESDAPFSAVDLSLTARRAQSDSVGIRATEGELTSVADDTGRTGPQAHSY